MRLLALAILFASTVASAEPKLPAHYAKLFDVSSTWTYALSRTTWDYDQIEKEPDQRKWKKKTDKLAPITCKVARAFRLGARSVSEVTCDREEGWKFTVSGMYLATPSGLRRYNNVVWPTTGEDLGADTDHELLIAAAPKAITKRTKEGGEGGPRYTRTQSLTREGTAWCTSRSTSGAPHDGIETICYGGVITRGRNDIGGELDDLTYRTR
ncbi:MAG: hypothetical protein IPQ07_37260 [Myxococcales bacterium]|nr:hypothetical protein [Myxococcales bacterium]